MKDENKVMISGLIRSDLKINKFKDKETKLEKIYVGFQLESTKKRISKPSQPSNFVWVNAYDNVAIFCNDNLSKDRQVLIEGTLETEGWRDPKNILRFKWYIRAEKITILNDNQDVTDNSWATSKLDVKGMETADYFTENPNA